MVVNPFVLLSLTYIVLLPIKGQRLLIYGWVKVVKVLEIQVSKIF